MALAEGSQFESLKELRRAVRDDAINSHVELKVIKADKGRFTIQCKSPGCPWRLHASCIHGGPACQIKSNREEHNCGGTQHLGNKEASSKWLAEKSLEKFKDHPAYKPKELIADLRREKGISISYRVAWKAKESAHSQIHGDHTVAYRKLRNYCQNILEANPGSVAFIQETVEGRFLRLFVSYNASIKGFAHCRPVIGLDGTHLKGRYLGILLTATGIDAQGALFPIAFGVVIAENDDNWCWFLQSLKDALQYTGIRMAVVSRHACHGDIGFDRSNSGVGSCRWQGDMPVSC